LSHRRRDRLQPFMLFKVGEATSVQGHRCGVQGNHAPSRPYVLRVRRGPVSPVRAARKCSEIRGGSMRFPAIQLHRLGLLLVWTLMLGFPSCARQPSCPQYTPPPLGAEWPDDEACQLVTGFPGCDPIYPTRRCEENDPSCGPEPYSTGRKRACYDADAPRIVSSAFQATSRAYCQHDAECFIDFTCKETWKSAAFRSRHA
jgi:hypothetical protein